MLICVPASLFMQDMTRNKASPARASIGWHRTREAFSIDVCAARNERKETYATINPTRPSVLRNPDIYVTEGSHLTGGGGARIQVTVLKMSASEYFRCI